MYHFFIFLNLGDFAEKEEYKETYCNLHRENNPKTEGKIFEEIYRESDTERDTKGRGDVTKLFPEGVAKLLTGVPRVEV